MASPELFEDPFDPDEYVERLAWRTPGGGTKGGAQGFNPEQLYNEFVAHIAELKILDGRIQRKVEKLESSLQREARAHADKINDLQKSNQVAFTHFQNGTVGWSTVSMVVMIARSLFDSHPHYVVEYLDKMLHDDYLCLVDYNKQQIKESLEDRINYVATKVVHLGDQLEGVNTPRAHAAEALQLMKYFDEFLSGNLTSEVFVNQYRVRDAAEIVHKLHLIAQELPFNRFAQVKSRIATKYHSIEQELLNEFVDAHKAFMETHDNKEISKMKELASTLSFFKGYQHCIDAFIDESIRYSFYSRNEIFSEIVSLCEKVHKIIMQVFTSPEQVMGKLMSKIYQTKLIDHVRDKLRDLKATDPERYLQHLYKLYGQTVELSEKLSHYKLGSDSNFLTKLTKSIFKVFLDSYIAVEEAFLREKATLISQRYYDSKNHTKKQLHTGMQDLKAVISDKTNIRFGMSTPTHDGSSGETYLSQELAINLLQETKMGFARCKMLSSMSNLPANASRIFQLVLEYLCKQHIEYAIDLALLAVPTAEPKSEPNIYFLDVVQQTNTVFHLFEKQFSDTLLPLVSASPKYSECLQKKKRVRERMELRLDSGIDRCLSSVMGWMKVILKGGQKRSDFSTDLPPEKQYTNACLKVCKYFKNVMTATRASLDGNNVESTLKEFGTRFHRLIYEHLQQYSFSSMGGMMAICDVSEYGKCAQLLEVPFVTSLFESLQSLCNLLVVAPENLKQVCLGDQFANLDRAVLHTFVQLRSDYKSAKLSRNFS